jgi:CheY-like chemotaxis protein
MEILLIEDGLMDARMAVASIHRCGIHHRLTLIRDGREVLRFLEKEAIYAQAPQPDLILLDLFLPNVDGFAILDHLRNSEKLRKVPVIVLTSSDEEEDRERATAADVNDFIVKPFNEEKFLSAIRHLQSRSLLADISLRTGSVHELAD